MPDAWDPTQYEKFAAERAQPFWDLVGLLEDRPIGRAVDLGCGTGELTAALAASAGHRRHDRRRLVAGDARVRPRPACGWRQGDIGSWSSGGDHDLVFANASLQWVPDHPAVVARWWAALATRRPAGRADPDQRRPPLTPPRRRGGVERTVPHGARWPAAGRSGRRQRAGARAVRDPPPRPRRGAPARAAAGLRARPRPLGRRRRVGQGDVADTVLQAAPARRVRGASSTSTAAACCRRSATPRRTSTRSSGSCSGAGVSELRANG